MRIYIFVQARMGSTRLPGKVLKPIMEKPLLFYLIQRLRQVKEADGFAILTTTAPGDDAIAQYCEKEKIPFFRGSEEDVLSRYYEAALKFQKPDAVVRITADCPLIDPEIIDQVIKTYKEGYPEWSYVSNTLVRTYPRGLDVEVFSFEALENAFHKAIDSAEREHVTLYIYRHPERFHLKNIASPKQLAYHRWTVDTPEDFSLIEKLLKELKADYQSRFRMQDILDVLTRHPDWVALNAHVEQKST